MKHKKPYRFETFLDNINSGIFVRYCRNMLGIYRIKIEEDLGVKVYFNLLVGQNSYDSY